MKSDKYFKIDRFLNHFLLKHIYLFIALNKLFIDSN